MQYPKTKRWKSTKYRKFISSLPCFITGERAEGHHVRIHSNAGTGLKPSDYYCLPVSRDIHNEWGREGNKFMEGKYDFSIYQELFKMTSKFIENPEILSG